MKEGWLGCLTTDTVTSSSTQKLDDNGVIHSRATQAISTAQRKRFTAAAERRDSSKSTSPACSPVAAQRCGSRRFNILLSQRCRPLLVPFTLENLNARPGRIQFFYLDKSRFSQLLFNCDIPLTQDIGTKRQSDTIFPLESAV